jgi:prepilin-type N-terminal cleavage/methylation domain-containing protein
MLRRARTPGFTLVETLVALVVLLAGLAGSTLLLIRTLQHERESAHRRTALRATASLAEELRARQLSGVTAIDPADDLVQDWATATTAALPAGSSAGMELVPEDPVAIRIRVEWPAGGGESQALELPVRP